MLYMVKDDMMSSDSRIYLRQHNVETLFWMRRDVLNQAIYVNTRLFVNARKNRGKLLSNTNTFSC